MKNLLIIYFAIGIIEYYLVYQTSFPDSVKWQIYFILSKAMTLVLAVAMLYPSGSYRGLKWMAIIACGLDLSSELDMIRQQGNYMEIFGHAFGVIMSAAIVMIIIDNWEKLTKWFRLQRKS